MVLAQDSWNHSCEEQTLTVQHHPLMEQKEIEFPVCHLVVWELCLSWQYLIFSSADASPVHKESHFPVVVVGTIFIVVDTVIRELYFALYVNIAL